MEDELRDDTRQVIQQASDVREWVQQVQDRAAQTRNRTDQATPSDPQRAVTARRHEIETLEHSIAHHEQAAELQERHGQPERAAEARARAGHDRDLLAQARAELAKDEAIAQDAAP